MRVVNYIPPRRAGVFTSLPPTSTPSPAFVEVGEGAEVGTMRINVYSQELTSEVVEIEKTSNTGRVYSAAQMILHSSERLHHPPMDDDRSAVTFWLPSSASRREDMAQAFERIAAIFRGAKQ